MTMRVTAALRAPILASLFLLPATAGAFTHLGGKWNTFDGPVEYTVSPAGSDNITDGTLLPAVKNAFHRWECVLCSDLEFRYVGDGPNEVAQDRVNAVFWLEDAAAWQQQVGADISMTLGVNLHFEVGEDVTFQESDTAFNGANPEFVWTARDGTSGIDVESIAVHEFGHMVGLGHACQDNQDTPPCLEQPVAIMGTSYPGGEVRELGEDDIAGICALYTTPKPKCEGYKRLKEPCERDCECADGLFCVPDTVGRMCSRPCTSENATCPKGTGCGLAADSGGARGFCVRNPDANRKADGMVCARDIECDSNRCERHRAINKLVCYRGCGGDMGECKAGYACVDGACLIASSSVGVPCDDGKKDGPTFPLPLPPGAPEPPGCACAQPRVPSSSSAALGAFLLACVLLRRRARGGA
jgi:hypothetical protein